MLNHRNHKLTVVGSALGAAVLFFINFVSPPSAQAFNGDWQRGVTITSATNSAGNNAYQSDQFHQSVQRALAIHANYVTLIIPIYQGNIYSTDVATGWNTPTDQALADAAKYIHSNGMKVMYKLQLHSNDGQWSANINPSDRTTWFKNYNDLAVHFAQIAQANGVEQYCIGNELISMSTSSSNSGNTQAWVNMINNIRGTYSGKLTYNANWGGSYFTDEKDHIDFWGSLDYIGISGYFNLSDNMQSSWDQYNNNEITPLANKFGKQVIFTEVGYRSVSGAHYNPWDYNLNGGYDPYEQVNDYEAMFSYWSRHSPVNGFHIWDWEIDPNAGGQGDTSYTPQNKPGQDTLAKWFNTNGSGGNPTPPPAPAPSPQPAGAFQVSANTSASPVINQPMTINGAVTNTGGQSSGMIVDFEIYKGGTQVAQKYYDNQNFNAGQTQNYSFQWTPNASGTYTLKVGIFTANWSANPYWNDNASPISVGQQQNPPPTPAPTPTPTPTPTPAPGGNAAGQVNIWWPSNGSAVQGIQPFKAMLTNNSVDSYKMFWQVDGGAPVNMPTNTADYPHKEALVDLSGWTWHTDNNYNVTFTAKDLNNAPMANQTIQIHVIH